MTKKKIADILFVANETHIRKKKLKTVGKSNIGLQIKKCLSIINIKKIK